MKKHVVIVAGGSGKRMGAEIPKQFLILNDKPVLLHTIEKFYRFSNEIEIVLVLPKSQFDYWNKLAQEYQIKIQHSIVEGGKERFYSVKNGLESIESKNGLVAIHDGVRPCVSQETISKCFSEAAIYDCAIPYVDIQESIRFVDENSSQIVNRNNYKAIQTPQVFNIEKLRTAYQTNFDPKFTDDASVFENAGFDIHLVSGNRENIKITQPIDLKIAGSFI